MTLITRYLFRHVFISTLVLGFILSGSIWLTQSLRFIDVVVNKGFPFATFLKLTFFLFPDIFGLVLPMAFFMGILFTYHKLAMDHELVVLKAVGMSHLALAKPVLLLGALITVFLFYINVFVMPKTLRAFKDTEYTLRNQASAVLIQEGHFINFSGVTVFVQAQKMEGVLEGILIHDGRKNHESSTLLAEKGYLVQTPQGLNFLLIKGSRQSIKKQGEKPEFVYFDEYTLNLTQLTESENKSASKIRTRKPYEMDLHELFSHKDADVTNPSQMRKMRVEGHKRFIMPILSMVFGFIAVGGILKGEFQRRRRLRKFFMPVSMALILQILTLALLNLGERFTFPIPVLYAVLLGVSGFFFSTLRWPDWGSFVFNHKNFQRFFVLKTKKNTSTKGSPP